MISVPIIKYAAIANVDVSKSGIAQQKVNAERGKGMRNIPEGQQKKED